jgi:transposase-like protein
MRTQETMFKIVEEYEKSGLSQKQFARQHELNLSTFTYWIRKKRLHQSLGGFKEVLPGDDSECLEICYPNGIRVRTSRLDVAGALIRLF